jgi:HEAT repeat protein
MKLSMRLCLVLPVLIAVCPPGSSAQPLPFEEVVRNLANPEPELRISAVRLLRDAKYPEALAPMAPLINDTVNDIQLETIGAVLSFFLVDDLPAKRKVAFVLEVRASDQAARAFERGPLAVWPKQPPAELIPALVQALNDDHAKVREAALYTIGVIGAGTVVGDDAQQLIKALEHLDPAVRTAAARVIGRLRLPGVGESLTRAMHDSNAEVRSAAMRALGRLGDATAAKALTDQLHYYQKGDSARAALDALAHIADPSSVPEFKAHLRDSDPGMRRAAAEGLGRTQDASEIEWLQTGVGNDDDETVRAAMAFALARLGQGQAVRLVDFLDSESMTLQVQEYLMELGPSVAPKLLPRLLEPDEVTRRELAQILGLLGGDSTVPALTPLLQDRDRAVVRAATQAIERIKLRSAHH